MQISWSTPPSSICPLNEHTDLVQASPSPTLLWTEELLGGDVKGVWGADSVSGGTWSCGRVLSWGMTGSDLYFYKTLPAMIEGLAGDWG